MIIQYKQENNVNYLHTVLSIGLTDKYIIPIFKNELGLTINFTNFFLFQEEAN